MFDGQSVHRPSLRSAPESRAAPQTRQNTRTVRRAPRSFVRALRWVAPASATGRNRLALRARQRGRQRQEREPRAPEVLPGDPLDELTLREARAVLENEGGEAAAVARFVAKLGEASPERREAVLKLLESIEALLPASSSALDEAF